MIVLRIFIIVSFLFTLRCYKYGFESILSHKSTNSCFINDLDSIYPSINTVIETHSLFAKNHYIKRIDDFKKEPLIKNDIVFLGNSITEQGGNWSEKFNNKKIKNRGISGDTTAGVLARLGEITYYKPKQVFILIGINDLFLEEITAEYVFNNILKIVNQIHTQSEETEIFVNTILPTSLKKIKNKIQVTNAMLLKAQKTHPFKIILLHQDFANKRDLMNKKFSTDGVHLNEKGYAVWVTKIKNLI